MSNYYFLASMLPPLVVGKKPDLSFRELEHLLINNLTDEDLDKIQTFRRYYDIQNIRRYWKEEDFFSYGSLNAAELEEALVARSGLPDYVYEFMERHDELESRLHHFSWLVAVFFKEEIIKAQGFLHDYFVFERELRLVLLAFRAKKLGRKVTVELQYEDPSERIVAQILAQKDAASFQPPTAYEALKALFEQHQDHPIALHQALCDYRFQKVNEMVEGDLFSIDRILGYIVRLIIVERWLELDREQGTKIVDTMIHSMKLEN